MALVSPKTLAKLLRAAERIEPAIPAALEATAPVTHSAALDALGPAVAIPGARPAGVSIPGARRVGDPAPSPQAPATAPSQPLLPVDASLGLPQSQQQRVVFRGKEPQDWEPHDFHDFGQQYGVPNLGPVDSKVWQDTLVPIKLKGGRTVTAPPLDRPWTYYDLQHLQAQGIDPNLLPAGVHKQIHNKMLETMQPQGEVSPERVINGYMMGLTSPNNPLTPNQLAMQRAMVKGPQDVDRLASMTPWDYKNLPSLDVRKPFGTELNPKTGKPLRTNPVADEIAGTLGLGAAPAGLGARGSTDLTVLPGLAQRARDNPDFYKFNQADFPGMSPAEAWSAHTERVLNATPGLKAKTASFGGVWQSPQDAAISAVDRHIAANLHGSMFPNQAERLDWEKDVLGSFNKENAKKFSKRALDRFNAQQQKKGKNFFAETVQDLPGYKPQVSSIEQLRSVPGGIGHYTDEAMAYVNNLPTAVTRTKAGDFNPRLPETLQTAQWPGGVEPKKMELLAGPYSRVVEEGAKDAATQGQGLFSNQWFNWDPLRKRLEPHGIMFPGLEKLPRMSLDQMKEVRDQYAKAGYFKNRGAVKTLPGAAKAAFFGLPLAALGGAAPFMPGATAIGDPRQQTY